MTTSSSVLDSSHGEPQTISAGEDRQSHATTSNNTLTRGTSSRLSRIPARKDNAAKSKQPCRFFASKNGCKAGDSCRYQHVGPTDTPPSAQPGATANDISLLNPHSINAASLPRDVTTASSIAHRASAKPVSQKELEDPREYQITQVIRRHSPFRADLDDKTTLKFRLHPTDPDFPFELNTGLHCVLNVPSAYPQDGKPFLQVQNAEMPRGFQINVEKGFDLLVTQYPNKTLLALLNELDKNLEKFLTAEKATTVKFVAPSRDKPVVKEAPVPAVSDIARSNLFQPALPRYSLEQLKEAKARRDVEIRQLEARLGRSENFSKAGDGVAFNVPLQLPSSSKIPASLRSLKESALIVPEVYPLEPCTIILRGVDGDDAENVEVAFEKCVVDNPQLSLMAHINYLTQNLGKLAIDTRPKNEDLTLTDDEIDQDDRAPVTIGKDIDGGRRDLSRPHIQYIARPPEWNVGLTAAHAIETDSSEYDSGDEGAEISSDGESDAGGHPGGASIVPSNSSVEKGVSISFPGIDMKGIELLELTSLSVTIKCERCKHPADIKDIRASTSTDVSSTARIQRTEACTQCTLPFTFTYRPELIHTNNTRAGYIDLENSTITSLLPSTFLPTCATCSTVFPAPPAITAIAGDTALAVCRSCHSKMTLHIPTVKFLQVSTQTGTTPLPLHVRKPKSADTKLMANAPLPDTGNCQHYAHSHRWFRFSCCNTVYPCDKCHDTSPTQKTDPHPNEHADRMICGWCSREQRYHPDTCRFCGRSVVKGGPKGSGFWEGGKGTRERAYMRRKEGRKFKRRPGEKKAEEEKRRKRKEGKGRGGMWWPG